MRSINTSQATFSSPSDVSEVDTVFVESADPADMQARVAEVLQAHPNTNWALSYIDLAGGGDGHTFVCTLVFASSLIGGGTPPENTRIFFYLASDDTALNQVRLSVNPQIAALFAAPTSAAEVLLVQTLGAGAAKGTRFMGAVLCTFSQGGG